MPRLALVLLIELSLSASGALDAQSSSPWQLQITNQLTRYSDALAARGYARSHEIQSGSLKDGESASFTIELDGGRSYALIGACDEDCSDIDLRLYDPDGTEIDVDVEADDYPVLEADPPHTGTYRVKVTMASCATPPCFYGVGVFAK